MVFVFDLDDTICETDAYSEYYINKFFKENNWNYQQIAKVTRFAEAKFNWPNEMAKAWYKKYGDEMMLEFSCKKDAIKTINTLYDNGHKIIIATARNYDWHSNPEEITLQWLKNVGLKVSKVYIGRVDKEIVCENEKADFFIDDDISITKKVSEVLNGKGKQAFLMNSDFNQTQECPSNVKRVSGFKQLMTEISKYTDELKK